MIPLEALLRVPTVDPEGFDISAAGDRVAFAWNKSGQWEIYQLRLNGSDEPQIISRGLGGKFSPKYSPDGESLVYVTDLDGGEKLRLYLHHLTNELSIDLTPSTSYSLQPNLAWSPDGKKIAFLADKDGHFNVYIMYLEGEGSNGETRYPIRKILDISRPAWDVKWSPDGRWLAAVFEAVGQDYHTYLVSPETGEYWCIEINGDPIDARDPAWSPESGRLAFSSDALGQREIGLVEIQSRKVDWITSGDGEKYSPDWSPDGKQLAFVHAMGISTHINIWQDSKSTILVSVEPGLHYSPKFTPDGESLLFVFDNPSHPNDLWQWDAESQNLSNLTRSLPEVLQDVNFVMPEEITYLGLDGEAVPALLYRSDEASEDNAAVVVIHGGPTWHFSIMWYPFMSHLASRGWTVLAPNYRGSTGYGREWQVANRFDLGGVDAEDCTAAAQHILNNGWADPERIGVTGRSHGGYLTMVCLTSKPELWACGSAIVPFLNWFTSHANSRQDLQHWDIENFGDPQENKALWHERSPFFFLDRITCPVQFICGENDPRCPAQESLQARDRLIELGCEVDFKLYKDEGHGFLKIENVIDAEMRRLAFLVRNLEKESVEE